MVFSLAFNVDQNVIQIYYYRDIKLFRQDLVDVALKYSWCVDQAKDIT